ncbi:MAG: phenylalanine--tRNA ligase beta subunit-related protein [Hyphomicrobiaceae bacterium]
MGVGPPRRLAGSLSRVRCQAPTRTPSSAEALRKRVERGARPPGINAVVDLYNAVSIAYALPVGGEDIDAYAGSPRLTIAKGDEPFQTDQGRRTGDRASGSGEVVWLDDLGVTCRRWNWRQGPRTRITLDTRSMWFVLERLEPMPVTRLHEAGEMLKGSLRRLAPGIEIEIQLIDTA